MSANETHNRQDDPPTLFIFSLKTALPNFSDIIHSGNDHHTIIMKKCYSIIKLLNNVSSTKKVEKKRKIRPKYGRIVIATKQFSDTEEDFPMIEQLTEIFCDKTISAKDMWNTVRSIY